MSWQQREYAPEDEYQFGGSRYRGSGMQTLSVTSTIIIANAVMYFLAPPPRAFAPSLLWQKLALIPEAVLHGEVWRIFSATYLHGSLAHIMFNMIALYFLGPALEQVWGRRQFFLVYTVGGLAGFFLLTLAAVVGVIDPRIPAIGASGCILTLLGAAAVLFPDARVYVYFLFPVRIRTCAIVYGIWYIYNIYNKGSNFGGDICHIVGLLFGIAWAYRGGFSISGKHRTVVSPASLLGKLGSSLSGTPRSGPGAWDAKMRQRREDEELIDRILVKIHEHGIQSLTPREQEELAAATRRRREEEKRIDQM